MNKPATTGNGGFVVVKNCSYQRERTSALVGEYELK